MEGGGRREVGCEQSLQETNRNILCWPSRLATLLTPRHCKLLIGGQLIIDTVKLVKCKDRLQACCSKSHGRISPVNAQSIEKFLVIILNVAHYSHDKPVLL